MTCFICNDAIVQPNNSSFIRQTPLIMLIVCVCPHSFNAKDIRGKKKKEGSYKLTHKMGMDIWLKIVYTWIE